MRYRKRECTYLGVSLITNTPPNFMLVPPDNFGLVETGIYRCSKLEADHFPFIETLQLKSLVLLDAAKPPRTLKSFLLKNKVDLYNLGGLKISNHQNTGGNSRESTGSDVSDGSGIPDIIELKPLDEIEIVQVNKERSKNDLWMLIEKNLIMGAFEILLNKTKHNLLLVDSSLALVGILRKIQKWNFNSIVNEYRIYTGNLSKNNYNVEVFLELINVELIPFEVNQCQEHRSSVYALRQMAPSRSSIDEGAITGEDEEALSLNDFEDDMDDDFLSASPQIPANLLKLVEQRKSNESPSMSPEANTLNERQSSIDSTQSFAALRRKSSVDSRYILTNKSRLRNPSFSQPHSPGRRPLFESSLRLFRLDRNNPDELLRIREKHEYKYYKASLATSFKDVEVIRLNLLPEHMLPEWFIRARDFWEQTYGNKRV